MLPTVLAHIGEAFHNRPDLLLASWPEIIGAKLAPMTRAETFMDGVLTVKVNNSTLYTLLNNYERGRIIARLREKFPKIEIKNVVFRIG